MIVRHENHPLAVEATLLANLGPISWLLTVIRAINGVLFGVAGRIIYYACHFVHTELPMLLDLEVRQHSSWVLGRQSWANRQRAQRRGRLCMSRDACPGCGKLSAPAAATAGMRKCEVAAKMSCLPLRTGLGHGPASKRDCAVACDMCSSSEACCCADLLGTVGLRAGSTT